MSLKAGRVGVAPDQVDEFGKIKSEATSGYTKQEADAKFQPLRLEVPVKYLNGSVIGTFNTVQEALSGSYGPEGAMTNRELTDMMTPIDGSSDITSNYTINSAKTKLMKIGKIVFMDLRVEGITASAWATLATIPQGFRPALDVNDLNLNGKHSTIGTSGIVSCAVALTSETFIIHTSWITS